MLLAFRQSVAESTGVDVSQVEVTGIHTDGDNTPGEPQRPQPRSTSRVVASALSIS